MRTSGGAGASLRDATPGPLDKIITLLLTVLLLCPLVAAESVSQPAPQRREWNPHIPLESHVVVGADGIATSRGAGRRRSDGLSITRSIPVEIGAAPDATVDDQAIKFTPARVDLGRVETCSPQIHYVGVENRGRVSVRLDGADFTHEGFSLANDVQGIRLDPGDRFNVQFVFVPSDVEPNGIDTYLRVFTTSGLFSLPISSPEVAFNRYGVSAVWASVPAGVRFGRSLQFINPLEETIRITEIYALDSFVHIELLNGSNWIGPRWPREEDGEEVTEVPGEYDPQSDYARRANRGAWDMPAGTISPLIKVSLQKNTPAGGHFTYIHIVAGERRLLVVPVRINVLKPGIHIEPKELDLGMLTDLHDDEHLEATFNLYNAGVNPIEILELKVLESNLLVSAQLRGGSSVIPPRTQVLNALAVQIRVDKKPIGTCFASLLLKTNASSSELGQRKLKLYGRMAHGNVAFQLNETRFGVIMPLENVLYGGEYHNNVATEIENEQIVEDHEIPSTKLVSNIGENNSMGVMAGTTAFRTIELWNKFDCPVELQRVWINFALPDQNEVSVYKFQQGVVPPGSAWPKVSLQITPTLQSKVAVRSYSLTVETNVTLHRILIIVYHGFLTVNSTRGLDDYSVSGYYSHSHIRELNSSQSCLELPKGGLVTSASPRIDGGEGTTDTEAVQICRSLLFDLEKVASHRSRTEVVTMRNENPVPVTLKITNVSEGNIVIRTDVSLVRLLDASVSGMTKYWNHARGHNSSGNNTQNILSGDSFVLQTGDQVEFSVEIQAKDTLGERTVPIMTVQTSVEIFHLYARLRIVRGTVEPVTPAIVLPSMFPGRTQVIHLQFRNTFDHLVTPLKATTSSSSLKILSMRDALAPNQIESVLELLFSPAESSTCSDARFLADCLLPLSDTVDGQTCEQLSDYGELVDKHDLDALSRRNAFWSRTQGAGRQSTVKIQVYLQTDIVEDVAQVTIQALFERPLVTAFSTTLPQLSNGSLNIFEQKEFLLTELYDRSHVFVNVHNPSNISIQVELTVAETDRVLFYSCAKESNANEESFGGKAKTISEDISSSCLAEWKAVAADAIALQREDNHVDINVPPFYFRKRIVQVSPGEEAQLGPIYYLPSKVQEVATTVFVRNDLSHIEPVPLLARSGKGTLGLSMDKLGKSRFIATERLRDDGEENSGNSGTRLGYDGALRFDVTKDDTFTDYSQDAEILLSNTGPFGLTIHSVSVEESGNSSRIMPSWAPDTACSGFVVTSDLATLKNGESSQIVLAPGTTARCRVSFCASCFATKVTSWLVIDTSDSIQRIRLHGTITTDAAFSCLRSRMAPPLRTACHYVWILSTAVAVISTLYSTFNLVHDAWTHGTVHEIQISNRAVDTESTSSEMIILKNGENLTTRDMDHEDKAPRRTPTSVARFLKERETTAFAPSARVVTPAVSKLLEQRHKGLCSSAGSSGNVQFHEDEEVTAFPATKVKCSENEATSFSVETESVSPSNVAFTATEASWQDVKEPEKETGSEDMGASLLSTRLPQVASSDNSDRKQRDSLSDDNSQSPEDFLSSGSSSDSTIVQPDAEESSRGVDFPQLSFGFPGDEGKSGSGIAPNIGTTPPTNEDGPFDAFKSLAARWRTEDWHDNLSEPSPPSLPENLSVIEGWNDTLLLNTLGHDLLGLTAGDNQRDENVRSNNRGEPNSFIGVGSGRYLGGFSAFGAASLSTSPKASTIKAPPGFTTADAKPLEARAAFEKFRGSIGTTPSAPTASRSSEGFGALFASKLPLFGPALPPDHDMLGRIGSGRSKVLGLDASTK